MVAEPTPSIQPITDLIDEALAAGLLVTVVSGKLTIRGSKSAEAIAKRLLARRDEVLEALHRQVWTTDPRPDLLVDSRFWSQLLTLAYDQHGHGVGSLVGALHGMRCYGAALRQGNGTLVLGRGEMTEGEYQTLRQAYLLPHRGQLMDLLHVLGS